MTGNSEEHELISICRKVEEILQGVTVNGSKQCPLIDWSVARWGTAKGSGRVEGVFACGMASPTPTVGVTDS